jgi:hypothetical protein
MFFWPITITGDGPFCCARDTVMEKTAPKRLSLWAEIADLDIIKRINPH